MKKSIIATMLSLTLFSANAETVQKGSGSYTTEHPGVDEANRNKVPAGMPRLSGEAAGKPVPTNDWWSNLLYSDLSANVFNYTTGLRMFNDGVSLSYTPIGQAMSVEAAMKIGLEGLSVSGTTVSDYSDWTVTINWSDGTNTMEATTGLAMPFVYFTKSGDSKVSISALYGNPAVDGNILVFTGAFNNAKYAIYAPEGSTWEGSGTNYTSDLGGKDYWSAIMLPMETADAMQAAKDLEQYAFTFPTDTKITWNYNEKTAKVRTDFNVTAEVKEGTNDKVLLGLLPHQWGYLAPDSERPEEISYQSVRGEVKTLGGNHFATEYTFHGILPTLPYVEEERSDFSKDELMRLIKAVIDDNGLVDWTDSYNDGQLLNRLVQTGRIAKECGDEEDFRTILNLVKGRVENWLTYTPGEVAFLFYYNKDWTTLIGYPAGHGQDEFINDHHFHWAYFIHAAAFIEQYEPGWAAKWGDMIDMLVQDVANTDPGNEMFPVLRNFSPYAGHCWANGMATLALGNDQESSSEAIQFHSSLIHWGAVTGDKNLRDLGIYMYATEQAAIDEYWFDVNERTLPADYPYSLVSRIFTNGFDNGTFWTSDIEASYCIELYPIHGGSFYLACHPEYMQKLWNEITQNTGILQNEANPNLWHDVMWEYLAFINPQQAISLYDSYPDRTMKFGISKAQTYHWLHSLATLGQFNHEVTADYPIAAAFTNEGYNTYVAHNYGKLPITVTFSDGHSMEVPAGQMTVDNGTSISRPMVRITSPAYGETFKTGETIELSAEATSPDSRIVSVEFFNGTQSLGKSTATPFSCKWTPENAGEYYLTAKATDSENKTATSAAVLITVESDTQGTGSDGCEHISKEAQQGSFDEGFRLVFQTAGTDVKITAELYDEKNSVFAYVWNHTDGFMEYDMTKTGEKQFTYTMHGCGIGSTLKLAVKFAFEGGMAVTKIFDYEVGQTCTSYIGELPEEEVSIYPNPVESELHLSLPLGISHVWIWSGDGTLVLEQDVDTQATIDASAWSKGIYFIRIENPRGFYVDKLIKK